MPIIQPFTHSSRQDVAPQVLLTWVDEVFDAAASYINPLNSVEGRAGFKLVTGTYRGTPVTIVRTPLGAHGTLIALEELSRLGANVYIKVGLGCAVSPRLSVGDIVVVSSAIKGDGVSRAAAPLEVPAIPDHNLTSLILEVLESNNMKYNRGMTWSTDLYYSNGLSSIDQSVYKQLAKYALIMDPDTAALFTIGLLKKLHTAAILVVEASQPKGVVRGELLSEEAERRDLRKRLVNGLQEAARIAIEALTLHHEHAVRKTSRRT
ncbi:MAG: nucleoside phosphorylase [Crenarchaeota archaeon]|nr:nucleoside phosphorylase [Thermoproteota archaeon]